MSINTPNNFSHDVPVNKPKKRRRIFMWFFLAVQVLFLIWLISGIVAGGGQPTDCEGLDAETCNAASDIGTAFGIGIVIILWAIVDFILGVGYVIYRLAKRP